MPGINGHGHVAAGPHGAEGPRRQRLDRRLRVRRGRRLRVRLCVGNLLLRRALRARVGRKPRLNATTVADRGARPGGGAACDWALVRRQAAFVSPASSRTRCVQASSAAASTSSAWSVPLGPTSDARIAASWPTPAVASTAMSPCRSVARQRLCARLRCDCSGPARDDNARARRVTSNERISLRISALDCALPAAALLCCDRCGSLQGKRTRASMQNRAPPDACSPKALATCAPLLEPVPDRASGL